MFANMIRAWNDMSTYRKIRRVISIGLILFAVWALSPYLYNRRVNEAFPAAVPAASTAMAEPTAMPAAMAEPTAMPAAMAEPTAMPAAMAEPTAVAAPTAMAEKPAEPLAIARGSFIAGSTPGDRASGSAAVYALENGGHVLRLEEFSTTNGPDLFVVLSSNANPDADGIGGNDSYVQLAALKGNQGNQNYELPATIELGQYKSVVIWCRTFNIVFGYATLES